MPQGGIDPLRQSHATYEARALPPSHHSWIRLFTFVLSKLCLAYYLHNMPLYPYGCTRLKLAKIECLECHVMQSDGPFPSIPIVNEGGNVVTK